MEKLLILKNKSFENELFDSLSKLKLAECIEISESAKGYTKCLLSKWNKDDNNKENYIIRTLPLTVNEVTTEKVLIFRVK
jgi:hypothetical protein